MGLFDFYTKAKKKLTDTLGGLGAVANTFRNDLSGGIQTRARSVMDFSNNPANTPNWLKSVDNGLHSFSNAAENVPKFNFTQKIKNPVGKFAAAIPETILNLPSNSVRTTFKDYGKIKATPSYMLKRGAEAANVGVDIGSTVAGGPIIKSLAKEGFKRAGKATLGQVFKEGAKRGAVEGGIYGTTQGALSGLQEGENLKEQGKNALKQGVMGGVMGVAAGGALGGLISSTGHEASRIKKDVANFKNPYAKRVVTKYNYEPVPGVHVGPNGQNQMRPIIGSERKVIETIKTPFQPQSVTGKLLTARPGMNIQDVNALKPKLMPDLDTRIAQKRAQAVATVNKQIENQKAGLPVAEKGFVAPQNVPIPEKKPLPSIEEFVNGKVGVKKSLPSIDEFVNGKTKTPEKIQMPDDIKMLQNMVDDGKLINPRSYAKLMSWKENPVAATTPKDIFQTGPYNKFQQNAFDKKGERVGALREVLTYPTELRKIGYKKIEIDKIGKEQADRILKLANLGFPKNAMPRDLLSDQVTRIIDKKVSWGDLKNYYSRKNALNTNFLEGIDPKTLQDINPLMAGGRDVYRNFEVAFGKNYPKIKSQLLDPFDAAKGNLFTEQEALTKEVFDQVVTKFGIKKGSALDKAVVAFGEGRVGLEKLQQDFPKDWEKIVEADGWFRNKYPELLRDLNQVRETNFPTHPLYPESSKIIPQRKDYYRHGKDLEGIAGLRNMFENSANIDPALAIASDVTNPKSKWLSFAQKRKSDENDFGAVEGYLDYIKNHSYAKHVDPFIQKFKGVDDEAKNMLPRGAFSEDNTRIGLAEEFAKKTDSIQQITEAVEPDQIQQILMDKGVSEKQAEWMSKELAEITNYEKTAAFLKRKLAKNTGKQLEELTATSSLAEAGQNKENNFLVFIKNFSRDLGGKTNPMDRGLQENVFGRKALSITNWLNSRFKANAVVGNLSSSVAQFFNVQQGFASAGARNSAKGLGDSLAGIFKENVPMKQSSFIRERYFDGYNKFDEGALANTKKFAGWIIGVGDEIGTKFIWNAHYRKALAERIQNPVKYADDWARKMVAGRGIGEVPILQKSKVFQLVAPFQLEVANVWHALRDVAKNDPRKLIIAKKMVEYAVASFLMNSVAKKVRGSDVSFDPINAMIESYQTFSEDDNKLRGVTKAIGRMAGEVISNLPLGQTGASLYPEYGYNFDEENSPISAAILNNPRKDFFGEGDPTRFGTGGLPLFSAMKNPLTRMLPSYGGRQIEKTYEGGKALLKGYTENGAGNVLTPVERNIPNVMRGVLFGKNAFGEMQDYYDKDERPLSKLQTEKFKIGGNGYFNSVMASRTADNEKTQLKKASESGKTIETPGEVGGGIHRLADGNFYVPGLLADTKTFKTEKLARMAITLEDFMGSDKKYIELDGRFYYKDPNNQSGWGSKTMAARNKEVSIAKTNLEMDRAKARDDIEAWGTEATKKVNSLNEYLSTLDPDIEQEDIDKTILAKENLLAEIEKVVEQGGFKKGKKLEEKYRYPLVDPEFMKIQSLIAGTGNRKFRMTRRALPLIARRLPVVHRTRRR